MNFLRKKHLFHWLLVAFVMMGTTACEKFQLCEEENSTFTLRYKMHYKESAKSETYSLKDEEIYLKSFTINGQETLFVVEDTIANGTFNLPLNPADTLTGFMIYRMEGETEVKDSLVFSYKVQDSIQSVDCGVIHKFSELKLVDYSMQADSILVVNPEEVEEENSNESSNEKIVTIYRSTVSAD